MQTLQERMDMNTEKVFVQRIGIHLLATPSQQSASAAGFDLSFCARTHGDGQTNSIVIAPRERVILSTGFAWKIPYGYVGQIWPRSGLAAKLGLDVLAGVVDSDYRGEVKVILVNHGDASAILKHEDRIAQMLIVPVVHGRAVPVVLLDETDRGEGGFGSTGV